VRVSKIPLPEIDLASLQKSFQIAWVFLERFVQDRFRLRLAVGREIPSHKGAANYAVTRTGRRHLLQSKSSKRRRSLGRKTEVHPTDTYRIKGSLPFGGR
jgi:ribosomal protein L35